MIAGTILTMLILTSYLCHDRFHLHRAAPTPRGHPWRRRKERRRETGPEMSPHQPPQWDFHAGRKTDLGNSGIKEARIKYYESNG